MLRRKPTALTISPEDLLQFEDHHLRQKAYHQYRKTGEDPNGWFENHHHHHPDLQQSQNINTNTSNTAGGERGGGVVVGVVSYDPNDELKPLPGDKARIVRGREERIVGSGSGSNSNNRDQNQGNSNGNVNGGTTTTTTATMGGGRGGMGTR